MPAGQTSLSIADLPFAYSVINIAFILINGELNDYTKLLPVALFAGLIGTFLVTTHPVVRLFDRAWRTNIKKGLYAEYKVKSQPHTKPDEKTFTLDTTILTLALTTVAIKYEKDKIQASIYFLATLVLIWWAVPQPAFMDALGIQYFEPIYIGLGIMLTAMWVVVLLLSAREVTAFNAKLKLQALFFRLYKHNSSSSELALARTAIDQSDWSTAKEIMETFIRNRWATSA